MVTAEALEHFSLWSFFLYDWNWVYILIFGLFWGVGSSK